jgi:two-component system, sensor histidine kinase and response regulator
MSQPGISAKILVVDDNPKNIQVIISILREAGYEIGFAMNGRHAIDLLESSPDYELILLDIKMPGMDGFEVCKKLKSDPGLKEIPVIFISGLNDLESIIAAFENGGVDYVTKPFNAKELLARVETHVKLRQKSREVETYAKDLEILNKTKDKFFSIIAHDLRNPFATILMMSKYILNSPTPKEPEIVNKYLKGIAEIAENGGELLDNLLNWALSQTGNIKFELSEINLEEAILKCITSISSQAQVKGIHVSYQSKDVAFMWTDEDMFFQVLRNLLNNAIKFTPKNGKVIVRAKNTAEGIEISVEDNGIGIPKEDVGKLFSIAGNIVSRPGTENEMGTGLGLILCKEFIEKMHGRIYVTSTPGKGSIFTFSLPVNPAMLKE